MRGYICLLILLTALALAATSGPVQTEILNKDWTLTILETPNEGQSIKGKQLSVNIPTVLHLDLLKNKLIDDPFYRNNHAHLAWVSDCKVKYSKKFQVSKDKLGRAIELVFKGIDTHSVISLNGKQIQKTENAFREYVVRVEKLIAEDNELEIVISPAKEVDDAGQQKNSMPFKYAHTRKACYQYSWDWAPYLLTLGVWKDVQIRVYDDIKISYIWARNKVISPSEAVINFAVQLELNLFKNEKISDSYALGVYLDDKKVGGAKINGDTVYADVRIEKPEFWWPNGFGNAKMYDFVVKIENSGQTVDERKLPYGIRTAELNLQNRQFQVKINGYPIYCKGGNYVPPDMLYPRLTNPDFKPQISFEKLLDDAVQSNFNMLRVWGGGQYESAEFYEMASRRGIMIFQDFMFSDSVYPSSAKFLENVQEEVKQQVRMIRNYPAVVIWCGNNEILQGINDWGWSSPNFKEDYHKLFEILIKKVLEIESPDVAYIPSSPIYGVGNYGFQRGGDFHYWGVWAGGSPFETYEQAVGPFNSEFGTQALPVWHSIKQFTLEQDRSYSSQILLSHEKHGSGFSTLKNYINRYMPKSKNFENEVYLSGLVQAYAIELAIIAQRSAKPKSYGTLYWQFNDAWPAISWAAVDYYGRWKPLQYMAKRTYPNVVAFTTSNYSVVAINDNLDKVEAALTVQIMSFDGNVLFEKTQNVQLTADSVTNIVNLDKSIWAGKQKQSFVYCEIKLEGSSPVRSTRFFSHFKDLDLPVATVTATLDENTNMITFSSDKLVKNFFIDHRDQYLDLCDNYFDLAPSHPVKVKFQAGKLSDLKGGLIFNSVRQSSRDEVLEVKMV